MTDATIFVEPVQTSVFVESTEQVLLVETTEVGIAIVEGRQGPAGAQGETGPQGPTGATGPQGPQGDGANSIVWNESPVGAVDGANPTFTLASAPSALMLHVNGLLQHEGASNDFTMSGDTITFTAGAIPQTGDVLLATYIP